MKLGISVVFNVTQTFPVALKAASASAPSLRSAQAHWPPANKLGKVCACMCVRVRA